MFPWNLRTIDSNPNADTNERAKKARYNSRKGTLKIQNNDNAEHAARMISGAIGFEAKNKIKRTIKIIITDLLL
jgi:hypothetical protein